MTDRWWKFQAFNCHPYYGWGSYDEAIDFQDILNAGREVNHYEIRECEEEEAAEEGLNLFDELEG